MLALLLPLLAHAAIFGTDDREAVTPRSAHAELGRSTAVAVLSANIEPSQTLLGAFKLNTESLSGFLCPDQRFATDPSLTYACSGFLVAPDLIATAGHCMVNTGESRDDTDRYCAAFSWLFDYRNEEDGKARLDGIPAANHYRCRRVVYAIREESAPFRDYALVQLDRAVEGRTPFPLAEGAPAGALTMLGHPFGTPLKASPGAHVLLDDPSRQSFLASLDAFEGNSGSVVLNSASQAVGILVGGTPSANLVEDLGARCQRYNRCDERGGGCLAPDPDGSVFPGYQGVGSEVQRIAPLRELLRGLSR